MKNEYRFTRQDEVTIIKAARQLGLHDHVVWAHTPGHTEATMPRWQPEFVAEVLPPGLKPVDLRPVEVEWVDEWGRAAYEYRNVPALTGWTLEDTGGDGWNALNKSVEVPGKGHLFVIVGEDHPTERDDVYPWWVYVAFPDHGDALPTRVDRRYSTMNEALWAAEFLIEHYVGRYAAGATGGQLHDEHYAGNGPVVEFPKWWHVIHITA